MTSGGICVAEPEGQVEVGDEPRQVAVVDPDEVGARVEDAGEVGRVVELDQGRHAERPGARQERRELGVVEDLGDQEDRVGAGEAGLDDLVLVDEEVLAQQRDRDRGADAGEVREVALEVGGVGQDAQAGGAVGLVGPGDRDRVEVVADDPGRGAGLLDLGDQPDRPRAGERGAEVARPAGPRPPGASISSSGIRRRAAATSRRFEATISSRMVVMGDLLRTAMHLAAEDGTPGNESSVLKR